MRFDFTTIPDRHNHDAIAIDGLGDGTGFAQTNILNAKTKLRDFQNNLASLFC